MGIWRYRLEHDIVFESSHLRGVYLRNEWVTIENCVMTIKAGYAWDGCTPSYFILKGSILPKGLWFGVWDGPRGNNGRPVTWRASLFHDALCQFIEDIVGLNKEKTLLIFETIMVEDMTPLWMVSLYVSAVRKFGPQDWK